MSEKLKPCPWCGDKAELTWVDHPAGRRLDICCQSSRCKARPRLAWRLGISDPQDLEREIIAMWNTRAADVEHEKLKQWAERMRPVLNCARGLCTDLNADETIYVNAIKDLDRLLNFDR